MDLINLYILKRNKKWKTVRNHSHFLVFIYTHTHLAVSKLFWPETKVYVIKYIWFWIPEKIDELYSESN